jgi:small subunit ribosomal protein S1
MNAKAVLGGGKNLLLSRGSKSKVGLFARGRERVGKASTACSAAANNNKFAVGQPVFEEVDQAFGALKDWNGELEDFRMDTDISKLVSAEDLETKRKEFEGLLESYSYRFQPGDRVVGLVLTVGKRGATVEIGAKLPAFCPSFEVSAKSTGNVRAMLRPGMEREFEVIPSRRNSETLFVSARVVENSLSWKRVMQLYEKNSVVDVRIRQISRGGALIELENLQGFVPKSHLGMDLDKAKEKIGTTLVAKFLEADPDSNRLVLSHRLANVQNNVKELEVGSVIKGKVVAVKDYGAFVDLGLEFNALLHVSQISYNRLFNVDQVLSVGDEIKAMVLSYDANRGRVSLSTKKLESEPGDMLRNPAKVFENAESMASQFRERVAAAEAVARASTAEKVTETVEK